jgi:phage gp36-like protein
MAAPKAITVLADQAVTAPAATGPTVDLGANRFYAKLVIEVSLLTVGESLAVILETSELGAGFNELARLASITQAGSFPLALVGCKAKLRARYELSADSARLSVSGISHQTYCETANINTLSLPPAVLAGVEPDTLAEACLAATDEALSYLRDYNLPLVAWGGALRLHTANMAAYHAMKRRGFNPENDPTIRMGYTDAIKWLQSYAASDPTIIDSKPEQPAQGAWIVSEQERGWQRR